MKNLLFPTDFSAHTAPALDWVRLIAHKTGAIVSLLHVFQPMIPDTSLPGLNDPGLGLLASQELEDISRERLGKLADELRAEGLTVEVEWSIGLVDDSILEAAKERATDLIVMGRSDLSSFFDRLAGSAVSEVAEEAPCPVLIVPVPDNGVAIRPAQVHTIAYAMQADTTSAQVARQTDSLVSAFGAELLFLTEDQLKTTHADLIVMELHHPSGFLDGIFHPNRLAKLIEQSEVPVLVYHPKK